MTLKCIHKKEKIKCKDNIICIHNLIKYRCYQCNGSEICEHNRRQSSCINCSKSLCKHKLQKSRKITPKCVF